MKKRMILGGTALLALLTAMAVAEMRPGEDPAPDGLVAGEMATGGVATGAPVTAAEDNPFAGLDEMFNEPGPEPGPDPGLTAEEVQAEDDYLRITPPAGETGDVPEALTENVPYETCDKVPEAKTQEFFRGTPDAYANRMFYDFARYERVLTTKDCTCAGKVAPFDTVQEIRDQITAEQGEDWNRLIIGGDYETAGNKLRDQVEAMCGGRF
ncbi:hypothetical protein [uncultured Paracoccus sp.]|uniref:hypothetical protein n=1 Tax=uncultured Paracoccus sp. TaxID=189685 RepID=UPI00262DB9AD|nr:hypothetical protein [uncultured Paracoccus sp.]